MGGRDSLEVFFVAGGGRCACKGGNPAYPYITTDWHFIVAEDIRWMLQLSGGRIRTAFDSYARSRKMEITESFYTKGCRLLEQLLGGNKSLTKQELMDGFGRAGIETDNHLIHYFLVRAETDGLVCSGVDKTRSRPMLCWKNVCLR